MRGSTQSKQTKNKKSSKNDKTDKCNFLKDADGSPGLRYYILKGVKVKKCLPPQKRQFLCTVCENNVGLLSNRRNKSYFCEGEHTLFFKAYGTLFYSFASYHVCDIVFYM